MGCQQSTMPQHTGVRSSTTTSSSSMMLNMVHTRPAALKSSKNPPSTNKKSSEKENFNVILGPQVENSKVHDLSSERIKTKSADKKDDPENTPKARSEALGVSVHHLVNIWKNQEIRGLFTDEKRKKFRNERNEEIENMVNMYDICESLIKVKGKDVICPRDGKLGAAYVDTLSGEDHVGKANVMLSYAWGNTAGDITTVLEGYCEENKLDQKRTYVWICCLCNNQHRFDNENAIPFDELKNTFGDKAQTIGAMVPLLSPWNKPLYITRVWCVFELDTAQKTDGCKVYIRLPDREKRAMFESLKGGKMQTLYDAMDSINVVKAEASQPKDKENILKMVSEEGGADQLNSRVRLVCRKWVHETIDSLVMEEMKKSKDTSSDVELSTLLFNVGQIFDQEGLHEKALEYYDKCRVIQESILPSNHLDLASTYIGIGRVYDKQGKYAEALEYYDKCRVIQETVLSSNHPALARTYSNIGSVYGHQCKYAEALEYHDKCRVIQESVLPSKHCALATTYNNIGGVYIGQGKYADALEYYDKCRVIRESVLPSNHPDLATMYGNIGLVYGHQGKYAEALEYFDKCKVIRDSVLPFNHPDLATTYSNIGSVYVCQGKYAEALEYYDKCRVIRESVLPSYHPALATTYNNIGVVYDKQGKYAEALEYYDKCRVIRESVLSSNHCDLATTYNNIGVVYDKQGKYAEAMEYFAKCRVIR